MSRAVHNASARFAGHPHGIAVLRAGALGDFLLGLPALQALRAAFPETPVGLAGPLPAARLALDVPNPAVTTVASIDDLALSPLFDEAARDLAGVPVWLRASDLAVVWLRRYGGVVEHLLRLGVGRVLARDPLPDRPGVHAADWLLESLAEAGIAAPVRWDTRPWLHPPPAAQDWAARWRHRHASGRLLVVLHAGSGSPRKNWSGWPQIVTEICRPSPVAIALTAGPADEAAVAAAAAAIGAAAPLAVLRDLDLLHLAALLAQANLYLGNDSGVSHLAASVGAPVVTVFGPTDPRTWRPRGPRVRVLGGAPHGPEPNTHAPPAWPEKAAVLTVAQSLLAGQAE